MHEPFLPDSSLPPVPSNRKSTPESMRIHGRRFSAGVAVLAFALFGSLWATTQQNPGKEDAAYWNDLAQAHLEHDQIPEVFESYEKAIAADPKDWLALYNLGDALLLSRTEAAQHYRLDEEKILDRVFELYNRALTLVPNSYSLAADVAESYYLVRPRRPARAAQAWRRALALAPTDWDRAECYLNLARTQINAGLYAAASNSLVQITDPAHAQAKERLTRCLGDNLLRKTIAESGSLVGENQSEACIGSQTTPLATAEPESQMLPRTSF